MSRITKKFLKLAGFVLKEQPYETPDEIWVKDDVEIWDFNGECWLVDALDQGGIDVEFTTVKQLSDFFVGCKRKALKPTLPMRKN